MRSEGESELFVDLRSATAADLLLELERLRAHIDALDDQLVQLLNARANCALRIGEVKQALGLGLYQPERETQVLAHARAVSGGPLGSPAITRLFERIIDEARRLEREAQKTRLKDNDSG